METTVVPNNSLANLATDTPKSGSTRDASSGSFMGSSQHRQKMSLTDVEIISKCMSSERKKTLMCTEQIEFSKLKHFQVAEYPKKKFSSRAPSEYEKYILEIYNVKVAKTTQLKYEYPAGVNSCGIANFDKNTERELKKKCELCVRTTEKNSTTCRII